MKDTWQAGDAYEYYMGRWSRLVAESFTTWLAPSSGVIWADIGCGSGALSEAIISRCNPAKITAIDQSEDFVKTSRKRLGHLAHCQVGNALYLPLGDSSVNISVSGLVLNFIPEPETALKEMRRITVEGGSVAVYIWDYAGEMDFLNLFWNTAVELNEKVSYLHEGLRFPGSNAQGLKDSFQRAGFSNIETAPIEITMHFTDFADYWNPFTGGQGPAPSYVMSLDQLERNKLRDTLFGRLPIQADGSITLRVRAWAAKGLVNK